MIRAFVFIAAVLFCTLASAGEARIVIADGAKTKAEAEQKLAQLKLPSSAKLASGYPRVVASDSIKGLNPGLHIVVLGVCSAADRAPIKSNGVGMNILLRHHAHLLKQLKTSARGVYSKVVDTDLALECPLWLFSEPAQANHELHAAWAAVQKAPSSAAAWVTLGRQLEADSDFSGADYCYSIALERDPKSTAAQDALYKLDLVGARDL